MEENTQTYTDAQRLTSATKCQTRTGQVALQDQERRAICGTHRRMQLAIRGSKPSVQSLAGAVPTPLAKKGSDGEMYPGEQSEMRAR